MYPKTLLWTGRQEQNDMSNAPNDAATPRWETLSREVQHMKDALNGFTLMGVLDREVNHIAAMEEEIDQKTREALMAHWLSSNDGEPPLGVDLG